MSRRAVTLALVGALSLVACSSSGGGNDSGGGDADGAAAGCNTVIFDPLEARTVTPWPNNFWTRPDATARTGLRLSFTAQNHRADDAALSLFPKVREQLEQLDGFGTIAALVFRFARAAPAQRFAIAAAETVQASSPVLLVELDSGEAVPLRLEVVEDTRTAQPTHALLAHPLVPLRPKTHYVAMIRRSADGAPREQCLGASPLMRRVIGEDTADLGAGYDQIAPDIPRAKQALIGGGYVSSADELAALTVFTTQSIREPMAAIVSDVEAYDKSDGFAVSDLVDLGPQGTAVAHRLSGHFKAIEYRDVSGHIVFDGAGKPRRAGRVELGFDLTVPASSVAAPPYPVAILAHGLNGDREVVRGLAEHFAGIGVASVAIDAPEHGERLRQPGLLSVIEFFALDLAKKTFDLTKVRDNFRQAYADLLQLSRLVTRSGGLDVLPVGNPDGAPEIAASEVMVVGHSLGGILGSGLLALDARCPVGGLAGAGAGLTNILLDSGLLGTFLDTLKPRGTSDADVRAFFPLLQTVFEAGDPGNFAYAIHRGDPSAPAAVAPKHVLYLAVEDDKVVPNGPNEALARAAGVPHVPPVLHAVAGLTVSAPPPLSANGRDSKSAGYFQYDLFNGKAATHGDLISSPEPREQLAHWLSSYLAGGVPEIIDPYVALGIER